MTQNSKILSICIVSLIGALATACGVNDRGNNTGGPGATTLNQTELTSLPISTSIQVINHALSGAELVYAPTGFSVAQATCPSLVSGCSANIRTVNYSNCILGAARVTGVTTLTYDTAGTCSTTVSSIPASGSVSRTTSGLRFALDNSESELLLSETRQNYKLESIGGGSFVSYTGTLSYSANILGMHRIRTNGAGAEVYNISYRTTSPITATGSATTRDRVVTSGTVVVDNNITRQTSTVSYTNLRWNNSNCCHPTSGLISSTVVDSDGREIVKLDANIANGGSCGTFEVTLTRGTTSTRGFIFLRTCE
jgi:hypothetical protein